MRVSVIWDYSLTCLLVCVFFSPTNLPQSPTVREVEVQDEDYAHCQQDPPDYNVEEPLDENGLHYRNTDDQHEYTDAELEAMGGLSESKLREMLAAVGVDPPQPSVLEQEEVSIPRAESYTSMHDID